MVNEFQKELKPKGIELAGYAVDQNRMFQI